MKRKDLLERLLVLFASTEVHDVFEGDPEYYELLHELRKVCKKGKNKR